MKKNILKSKAEDVKNKIKLNKQIESFVNENKEELIDKKVDDYIEKNLNRLKGERGRDGNDGLSIKGKDGENGKDGIDGKTPVKGKDYFTQKDIDEIVKIVKPKDIANKKELKELKKQMLEEINSLPEMTAKDIKKKLESLKGNDRLDVSSIKGIGKEIAKSLSAYTGGVSGGGGSSGGGGASVWGSITGTLSNQTDLNIALAAKLESETDPIFNAWDKDYDDLTNKPTIPTNTNQLTNGAGFITLGEVPAETDPVFTAWDKDYADLTNKPTIPDELADLAEDTTHRVVTDAEKITWNGKQNALGFTPEDVANKENVTIDTSTTKYPTINLLKTYTESNFLKLNQSTPQTVASGEPDFDGGLKTNYVQFDTTFTGAALEGKMFWNVDEGTANIGMPGGNVNLQVGQELMRKVYNDSGADMYNGNVVYISGSTGQKLKVTLASAASGETWCPRTLYMLTEDIQDKHYGYATYWGDVHDVNTDGMTAGSVLWLSPTTPGAYQTAEPTSPAHKIKVGGVLKEGTNNGIITMSQYIGGHINDIAEVQTVSATTLDILQYDGSKWANVQLSNAETDPDFNAWLVATPPLYSESDPVFTSWDKDYADLTNKPTIPADTGWTNVGTTESYTTLNAALTAGKRKLNLTSSITEASASNFTGDLQIKGNGYTVTLGTNSFDTYQYTSCVIENVDFTYAGTSYMISSNLSSRRFVFVGCQFRILNTAGFVCSNNMARMKFDRCYFDFGTAGKLVVTGVVYQIQFDNCEFYTAAQSASPITISSSYATFTGTAEHNAVFNGCYFSNSYNGVSQPFFTLDGGVFVQITGSTMYYTNTGSANNAVFYVKATSSKLVWDGGEIRLPGAGTPVLCRLESDTYAYFRNMIYSGSTLQALYNETSGDYHYVFDHCVLGHDIISTLDPTTEPLIELYNTIKNYERRIYRYINGSGGNIEYGSVVILKSDGTITTTTTKGDGKVIGVALRTTSASGWCPVLVEGKTFKLKVDGTDDIAAGDLLTTYSTVKIACKAAYDDMVFAMAITAYSTNDSNGVIQARIITPRVMSAGNVVFNETGSASIDTRAESDNEANMFFLDASADKLYLGGTTNGIEVTSGGAFKLLGSATVWDDLRVEPTVRGSGAKVPTYTNWSGGIYMYYFTDEAVVGNEKEVNFKVQMPHGWKLESAIHPHVHWIPITTGNPNEKVRWGLEYSKANINGVLSAPQTIYVEDPESPPSTTPTINTHYLTEFASIDMTGGTLSTILLCRLFRNSSATGDTFGGTAGLLYIDIHYEIDALGSNDELAK